LIPLPLIKGKGIKGIGLPTKISNIVVAKLLGGQNSTK